MKGAGEVGKSEVWGKLWGCNPQFRRMNAPGTSASDLPNL